MPSGTGAARGSMLLDTANVSRINADNAYKDIPLNDAVRQIRMNQAQVQLRPDMIANMNRQADMAITSTKMDQSILNNKAYLEQNLYRLNTDTSGAAAQEIYDRLGMGNEKITSVQFDTNGRPKAYVFDSGMIIGKDDFVNYVGYTIDRADDQVKAHRGILATQAANAAELQKKQFETDEAIRQDTAKQETEYGIGVKKDQYNTQKGIIMDTGSTGFSNAYGYALKGAGYTQTKEVEDPATGEKRTVFIKEDGQELTGEEAAKLQQKAMAAMHLAAAHNQKVQAEGRGQLMTTEEAMHIVEEDEKRRAEVAKESAAKEEERRKRSGTGAPDERNPRGIPSQSPGERQYSRDQKNQEMVNEEIRRQQQEEEEMRGVTGKSPRYGVPGIDTTAPRR